MTIVHLYNCLLSLDVAVTLETSGCVGIRDFEVNCYASLLNLSLVAGAKELYLQASLCTILQGC